MPRDPHYWKRAKSGHIPSEIVVVDTETVPRPVEGLDGAERHVLRLGCALAYRLEKGKRSRVQAITFTRPEEFWEFLSRRIHPKRPVTVVGHNLAFDLGSMNAWSVLCSARCQYSRAIVDGGIFLLEGLLDGKPIVWLDLFNYFKCSLATLGKMAGLPKMDMPAWEASDRDWADYCRRDVEVTAIAFDTLVKYVKDNEYGPWGPTIASLAFSTFRRRFMSHKVLVHANMPALTLERVCYYGGIVDTPIIGPAPASPVWECDVQSMYPYCCLQPLPHRIVGYSERLDVNQLLALSGRYYCYADVTVQTDRYPYPLRHKGSVYYPLGTYRTCLPHPELAFALRAGHVQWVHRASWHHAAPIFHDYMVHFYSEKDRYRSEGNDGFATVTKYLLNSLYGKTGQLSPRWEEWSSESLAKVARAGGLSSEALSYMAASPPELSQFEETYTIPDQELTLKLRNYWGQVEVLTGHGESRDSYPAIAATVTSRARLLLRRLQQDAGWGNWYYSDTDSIWVSAAGLANLRAAGRIQPGRLGSLDVKGHYPSLTVWAPKDYQAGEVVKRKGVRSRAKEVEPGVFEQLQFPSAKSQLLAETWEGVVVRTVRKRLHRRQDKCIVGVDGWTRPFNLPLENSLIGLSGLDST